MARHSKKADGTATPNFWKYAALKRYIDRIGAEEKNFRKFIVKEYQETQSGRRYYKEVAAIRLNTEDGSIDCSDSAYVPTKEEEEEIKIEVRNAPWPKSIGATARHADDQRRELGIPKERWFACFDLTRKKILFCQERKETETGDKNYYAWSYWDDGYWRQMEPDGLLPFWKPEEVRHGFRIMIHEGAKAARFVDRIANDPKLSQKLNAHPWGESLSSWEHWGIMGGALAPQRADFEEVRRANPSQVAYVCDRDPPGERALQKVSELYGYPLVGIRFDDRWPDGWDLADDLPPKLFKDKRYIGPSLSELMVPATWATKLVSVDKKKVPVLTQHFKSEWIHSVEPEAYVNVGWPRMVYFKQDAFNRRVQPYSHAKNTAELLRKDDAGKVETLTYTPALPSGIVAGPPRAFNTHQLSSIRAREGDARPWLRYLTHLFPKKSDRLEVLRWVATLVVKPEVKMTYGLLLLSEAQGVGKSTLGEKILTPLLGEWNVSFPHEETIVESKFNGWIAHRRLAVVNEIYAGSSWKAYNKLKSVVTDKLLEVNRNGLHPVSLTPA